MNSYNSNPKCLKSVKKCPNHCGTWIAWSPSLNRFIQAKTGEIHLCPKWKARQQRKRSPEGVKTLKGAEVVYVDTIGPAILSVVQEVLKLLRKIDDSIEISKR